MLRWNKCCYRHKCYEYLIDILINWQRLTVDYHECEKKFQGFNFCKPHIFVRFISRNPIRCSYKRDLHSIERILAVLCSSWKVTLFTSGLPAFMSHQGRKIIVKGFRTSKAIHRRNISDGSRFQWGRGRRQCV